MLESKRYRGETLDSKEIVYGDIVKYDMGICYIIDIEEDSIIKIKIKPESIGEYSNLKDKIGKNVYSDDLIVHNGTLYKIIYRIDKAAWMCTPLYRNSYKGNFYLRDIIDGTGKHLIECVINKEEECE